MDIVLPKIVRPVALSEYAPEFGEATIWMWVNPPREMLARFEAIRDSLRADAGEAGVKRLCAWLAEAWSQGPEGTHWSADEVGALVEGCGDTDPALMNYIVSRCVELVSEHRWRERKN